MSTDKILNPLRPDLESAITIDWTSSNIKGLKYGEHSTHIKTAAGFTAFCHDESFAEGSIYVMRDDEFDKMIRHQASLRGMSRKEGNGKSRSRRRD